MIHRFSTTGFRTIGNEMKVTSILVQMTNDEIGKTLSLSDEKIMLTVPFEKIEQFMKKEEKLWE